MGLLPYIPQIKPAGGPGYCHFPVHPTFDEEHFKQMTSEKVVTEYQRGFPIRKWKKVYRNEVLDCRVYATAALLMREVQWKTLMKGWDRKHNPDKPKDKLEAKPIESKSQGELIHVTFTRGIRWKGSHAGPGSELDVTIQDAKELLSLNAIKDVKLPQSTEPLAPIFKLPSTKSLRNRLQ